MVHSEADSMDMNFNLKVKGGKRTPVIVSCEPPSVNAKIMMFANVKHLSDTKIAEYISFDLNQKLSEIQFPATRKANCEGGHNARDVH